MAPGWEAHTVHTLLDILPKPIDSKRAMVILIKHRLSLDNVITVQDPMSVGVLINTNWASEASPLRGAGEIAKH